jgi:hypothetical protein
LIYNSKPSASIRRLSSTRALRRFPPPWSVEETDACFIVRDKNGQALAYVYFEGEPGRARGCEAPHPDVAFACATPS